MRLKVLDQIQVTAVQTDVLKPGSEFNVADELGNELLKRNPRSFEVIGGDAARKSSAPPKNKAKPAAPANKATTPRKSKAKSAS